MTQGELEVIGAAITGGFVVLGAAVRWSAGILRGVALRIVKAIDDSTAAIIANTTSLTRVEGKLEQAHRATLATADTVEEVANEISGVFAASDGDEDTLPMRRLPTAPHHRRTSPHGIPAGEYRVRPKRDD